MISETTAFITTLPDIPRMITALAQWLSCMVYVLTLRRRITGWKFAAAGAGFLVVQNIFLIATDGFEDIAWNLCMLIAWVFMFLFIQGCADISKPAAVCYCCSSFMTAELAASAEWQIHCYIYEMLSPKGLLWAAALLLAVFALFFFLFWQINRNLNLKDENLTVTRREAAGIFLTTVVIFAISNLGFLSLNVPFAGRDSLEIFNMRTLTDLGGAAILYAYQAQWKSSQVQRELENIQNILMNQYEQYKQAQRTVDLINFRYHDLKNHMIALRSSEDAPLRQQYLDQLEKDIHSYEALNKTGNQVLDTLLTSKSLHCMQHKIDLTYVIDGSLFDFMDVMDICSIFGNALDNAIECEKKIKDYDKRMIHINAFSEKNFLIIRFENYYEGDIRFEKGLPVTTKKQAAAHVCKRQIRLPIFILKDSQTDHFLNHFIRGLFRVRVRNTDQHQISFFYLSDYLLIHPHGCFLHSLNYKTHSIFLSYCHQFRNVS